MLSGGGGRGIAHIGALIGIEQRGWSPELVVGTSMGAIVGGLFAAGYAPDSIARLVQSEDWRKLFTRDAWLLGSRRSPRWPLIDAQVGRASPVSWIGLIDDVRVNRQLLHLLFDAGVRAGNDFDRLPRRFRAVSADLVDGAAIISGSGDLARAVRASMAVPGVFAPVVDQGRVLVDGGIALSLPVAAAWDLGAARVIAVDVIRPSPRIESIAPFALGSRAFRLVLGRTRDGTRPPTHLVVPELPDRFSAAYFPRHPEPLIRLGEVATLSVLPFTDTAYRPPPQLPAPARVGRVIAESSDPALEPIVQSAFRDVAAAPYSPRLVFEAVDQLYASGLFRGVWPRVEVSSDTILVVRAEATPATRLGAAAAFENDAGAWAWAAVRHRPGRGPLELTLEGGLGGLESFASLGARRVFTARPDFAVAPGAAYTETVIRLFDGDDIVGEPDVGRAGGWLGLEWRSLMPERFAALTLRGEYIWNQTAEDGFAWGPFLRLGQSASAPVVVGEPALLEAETRWGDIRYRRVRAAGSLDGRFGRALVAAVAQIALASRGTPADAQAALGNHHAVPGLRWGRERGRSVGAGGFDVAYPIPFDGHARLRVRAGFANDRFDQMDDSNLWIGGLGLTGIWLTPVGGATLGAGITDRGDWRIDFTLGGSR